MKKRTSMLIAVAVAFLAGRSVHAGDFVDAVVGDQNGAATAASQSPGPSFSFVNPDSTASGSQAAQGTSPQQAQYQKFIADRDARKASAAAEYERQYQEKMAKAEKENEEIAALKADGAGQATDTEPQQDNGAPDDDAAAVMAEQPPQPAADDDGSALSSVYTPKLGYPYTSD